MKLNKINQILKISPTSELNSPRDNFSSFSPIVVVVGIHRVTSIAALDLFHNFLTAT